MARSWQRIVVAFGSMILITFTSLNGQGHWNASNCGNYAPTLDRIVTNSCSSYEPDEYFIFHTNNSNLNVSGQQLSIRVNVTNGSFVSDRWTSNPTALQAMNQQSGCGKPLFLDPFAAPYNGTIPAHANVIAFVQRSPDFSGKLSGLCSQKAIFVLFGNYTPGFIKSMFANTCGSKPGCTRHIVMNLGGCSYDIVYEPDRQSNKNGDYIYGSGNSIRYGNASSCHPVFAPPKYTPPPILNRTELMKCENDADIFHNFSVMNGDNFTAWYTNINDPPIHRGPTFRPPASLFPQPVNSQTASRSLFVANEYGGRSGKPVELTLTTYPSPLTASISLLCGGDQTCNFCDGQEVLLELDLDQNTQQGGFPYSNLIIKNNTTEFPITPLQTGINKIVLPPPSSANNTYRTVSVENKYGCISTSGFKVGEQAINIQKSTAYTLPKIPDMCTSSNKFPLPLTVDQVTGSWFIQNRLIKEINPKSLKPGIHFATFKPSKPCHSIDSMPFQISPVPTAEILLSDIDCSKSTYTPQLSRSSSAGGKWSISPKIPIDGVTGSVSMKDFFPGTTYTWSYHVGTECMIIVEAAITARDCVCKISSRSTALSCNDNATPSDSTDDTFTFDLVVTGKNHSGQWIFQDGSFSGTYDTPTPIGPFRISDGTQTIRIRDHVDPTCTTEITIDPPPACSNQCEISAALTQVTCHDNGTPSDTTDDNFTSELSVTGRNHSGQWIFQDGSFSGTYDTPTPIGPFRISDGTQTIRIRDHDDPTCTTEITIDPPPACSNQCEISAAVSHVTCHDNATPSDSTDDTFTFDLVVTGKNHSGQWIFQDGSFSGTYDTPTQIGPFRISDGTRTIRIRDHDDPTCTTEISIAPPPACSNQCEISAALTQVTCHDNSTPSDSTDDNFTFELSVSGQNHSGNWTLQNGSFSGTYDTPTQIGPFRISDGTRTIRIRDHDDPTCTTEITIDPPPACSNQCEISAAFSQVTCHDNGTPSDSTDDNFTFELSVSGQNHSGNWTLQDGSFSGIYDTPTQIGPFRISDGTQTIRIRDHDDPTCTTEITIEPPSACSNQCEISAAVSHVTCHDNGTPSDSTDDNFTFELSVSGQNHSGNWTLQDGSFSGTYDTPTQIGPFRISDRTQTIRIRDHDDPTCTTEFTIEPPPACSNQCEISAAFSQVTCHDNGTPSDTTDDNFTFDLSVSGQNHSESWTFQDGSFSGTYDTPTQIGPFRISERTQTIRIRDHDDPTCTTEFTIEPPSACSNQCEISAAFSQVTCHDNGTPSDSTDDNFTFDLSVTGRNHSGQWIFQDGSFSGTYDTPTQIGPFSIHNGQQSIRIIDANDQACQADISIDPPPGCSSQCELKFNLRDSCVIDSLGEKYIYYFIQVNPIQPYTTIGIYFQNQLFDIVPGSGEIPIGPFMKGDIGKEIFITHNSHTNCQHTFKITAPLKCEHPCNLKITDISHPICLQASSGTLKARHLSLRVYSNTYPVLLQLNDHTIGKAINSDLNTYTLPTVHRKAVSGTYTLSARESEQCSTEIILNSACLPEDITFPNAFTPNQDGANDLWIARLPDESKIIRATIYDRWGRQIYNADQKTLYSGEIIWNGMDGSVSSGTGVYKFEIIWTHKSKKYIHSGDILLIR